MEGVHRLRLHRREEKPALAPVYKNVHGVVVVMNWRARIRRSQIELAGGASAGMVWMWPLQWGQAWDNVSSESRYDPGRQT